jgi:selenocysteine-specific elongation factor
MESAPMFTFGPPPGRAISAATAEAAEAAVLNSLTQFHADNPRSPGMRVADMAASLPGQLSREAIQAILRGMVDRGSIVSEGACLRLGGFRPQTDNGKAQAWADLVAKASEFGATSFGIPELADRLDQAERQVTELITAMRGNGDIWRISQSRFLTREQVYTLADAARQLSERQPDGFSAADLRDATAFGRNLLIEVLEFFDDITLTRRDGNLRVVRGDTGPILARAARSERALPLSAYLPSRRSGRQRQRR